MTRRTVRWTAVVGAATIGVLMWPGPAHGETTLGGYSGLASAQPVRIQVYEPTIPIPATPQIDGGIAYTRANTDTGPVSRALASYLWALHLYDHRRALGVRAATSATPSGRAWSEKPQPGRRAARNSRRRRSGAGRCARLAPPSR